MSDNTSVTNQTEQNVYLSAYDQGADEPTYTTYVPPNGTWTPATDITRIIIVDKQAYDSDNDAITAWAGEYDTETEYFGDNYSPLVIADDGTVTVAGQQLVDVTFDEDSSVLSWPSQEVAGQTTKATITFSEPDGVQQFSGSINPRAQDGPVSYTGTKVSD